MSIILPVLDEEDGILATVDALLDLPGRPEVVVVDGDPEGGTIRALGDRDATCLCATRGRASQMNAGARVARGDVLLFLHADCRLPHEALTRIDDVLRDDALAGGCFAIALDDGSRLLRIYSGWINLRTRLFRIPVGDQAIFVRRSVFDAMGGYPDLPILEEIVLMRGLKRAGHRIAIVRPPVRASSRRFRRDGPLRRIALNIMIGLAYYAGIPPRSLARLYGPQRPRPDGRIGLRADPRPVRTVGEGPR